MDILAIFTDFTAVIIFCSSILIAEYNYRHCNKMIKLRLVAQQSFYLSVIAGSAQFVYAMSTTMTLQNKGSYLASLLLPIFYSAIFIVSTQFYLPNIKQQTT